MKIRLLVLALLLSLAANAWLALSPGRDEWRTTTAIRAGGAATSGSRASASGATAAGGDRASLSNADARRGVVWREPRKPEELRALADELRAAGFPPSSVRFLIASLIQRQVRGSSDFAQLPFWHQTGGGKVAREVIEKMNGEARTTEETVLGKREFDATELDPIARASRYGNLPDEKIEALMKIERDYGEVYWQQRRNADGGDATQSFEGRNRIRLIEEEKEKDLAAALSPEEFADYARRRSRAALAVIQGVADIEISESEYAALYETQRRYLASLPRTAGPEEASAYQHQWAAPAEQVRAILGDERFESYMARTDPVYGATAKFAQTNPALARSKVYELYQLQSAALLAAAQAGGSGRATELANTPEARAALAPFAAKLDALLGPELAAVYRKTPQGKIFPSDGKP